MTVDNAHNLRFVVVYANVAETRAEHLLTDAERIGYVGGIDKPLVAAFSDGLFQAQITGKMRVDAALWD